MKKLLCLLLLVLFLPLVAFADTPSIISHYSLYFDARLCVSGKNANPFDYDMLCLDVYFTDDDSQAYFSYTEFFAGTYISSGLCPMTVARRDGLIYLTDGKGSALCSWYDENGTDLWLTYRDHDFRLHPTVSFALYEDWQ